MQDVILKETGASAWRCENLCTFYPVDFHAGWRWATIPLAGSTAKAKRLLCLFSLAAALQLPTPASAADMLNAPVQPRPRTEFLAANAKSTLPLNRQAVIDQTMRPFTGTNHPGVSAATLAGKIMAGYQGWFAAPGDGSERGWAHWQAPDGFQPGSCKIDLWPDVSELDLDERYTTSFVHADGTKAEVFSSFNRKTVLRHFQWMQTYGVDGVFVQRFVVQTSHARELRHINVVLDHCREGANLYGRVYAVMYDLSGLGAGQMHSVSDDWKLLIDRMRITSDPAYLRHNGKPVVAVWGFGFSDDRKYTLQEGLDLVKFLKDDPQYGNCTVLLGLPAHWRTLNKDAVHDPALLKLIQAGDIVCPWTVGRYVSPAQAVEYAEDVMRDDMQWCAEHHKDYLPVVFPGFSWHNMKPESPANQIPRRKGEFLWTQYAQARKVGATMVYQAMFDEVDEGTAIFKCTDNPPIGASTFITFEGLPSDFYLKLVGQAGRMLRGDAPLTDTYAEQGTRQSMLELPRHP